MTLDDLLAKFEHAKRNGERYLVKCPAHEDGTASLQISEGGSGNLLVKCFAGCTTESVCASLNIKMSDLFAKPLNDKKEQRSSPPVAPVKPKLVKSYDYYDARGRLVYQACRLEPKSFRQRRPNPKFDATIDEDRNSNPRWLFNMEGVTRVLYRLPQILTAETVWLVEGEKDADSVHELLGVQTTTNVGGAKKWLDAYTDSLEGKDVVICGDNDAPGKEHVDLVFESIAGKVKSARIIELPDKFKDVTEFIEAKGDKAKDELLALLEKSPVFHKGLRVPVYSMAEIEPNFERFVEKFDRESLPLGKWLPKLFVLDPLMGGDVVLIIGGTGVAKTALAQNIVMNVCLPQPTLFFEIELTLEKMFRRNLQVRTGQTKREVMDMYRQKAGPGRLVLEREFANLAICPQSKLSVKDIERIIVQSALKIGEPPKNVVVDYVQLVQAEGKTRYERASNIAEELKVIAKACDVRMFVLSQVGRPPKDDKEAARGVGLYDAKDSGSLENSSAVTIGIWRDPHDATLLTMRVLKATEGGAGTIVKCNFDGANMMITQRADDPSVED